jgi:molybdate transport system substrate-binding protein
MVRTCLVAFLCLAITPLAGQPALADSLTVFAAASLKNALDDIGAKWRESGGGTMAASYASSSTLAKQIEQGAPADVYISADQQWMDYVDKKSLVEKPHDLLGNRLVLIAGNDSKISLKIQPGAKLSEAVGDGKLAVGDPTNVPAGIYAKEALANLKLWESVEPKLAPAADVRAALTLVSRGEAPLGIVYETDAKVDDNVRIVSAFPDDSHKPIVYPVALVKASKNPDAAKFVIYLSSPAAKEIFAKYGFTVK